MHGPTTLLLAVLATTAAAAPIGRMQISMGGKLEHTVHTVSDPYVHKAKFKTPFVTKVTGTSVPVPKTAPRPSAKAPSGQKAAWLGQWKAGHQKQSTQREKRPARSCFCAGGSVCCSGAEGVDCNFGICGV